MQQIRGPIVVDASEQIMGRLASKVAKLLLDGERVVIVNSERVLVSGSKRSIIDEFLKKLEIGSIINPKHGPFHARRPDTILSKVVRGMVPRKEPKGASAIRRLRVFVGLPDAYAKREKRTFDDAKARKPLPFYTTLGEVATRLGWRSEGVSEEA